MEQAGRGRRILGSGGPEAAGAAAGGVAGARRGVKIDGQDYWAAPRGEARSDIFPEEQHQSPASFHGNNSPLSASAANASAAALMAVAPGGSSQLRLNFDQKAPGGGAGIDEYTPTEAEARARVKQYCDPQSLNTSTDEGRVGAAYRLLQVHVVTRHGDRSPMYGVGGLKKLRLDCTLDAPHNPLENLSAFREYRSAMEVIWQGVQAGSAALMYGLYPKEKTCMGAQLTGTGAAQHLRNGINLKRIYIDKHRLLQSNFNASELHIRTTPYSRTYQSAIAFLYGFLPKFDFHKLRVFTGDPPNFCASAKNKSRGGGSSCGCANVNFYGEKADKETRRKRKSSKLYSSLTKELARLTGTTPDKLMWISSVLEYLNGFACHSVPLPCSPQSGECFTWPLVGRMWNYRDEYMSRAEAVNYSYRKYARLYMHPLLREIGKRMGRMVRKKDSVKFVLYSGHDMTITPLTTALGFNEGLHPPYASRVVFELYKYLPANGTQSYMTRFLYNGKDVTRNVVFCAGQTNSDGLCPVEHFLHYVTYDNIKYFGANSFEEACHKKS